MLRIPITWIKPCCQDFFLCGGRGLVLFCLVNTNSNLFVNLWMQNLLWKMGMVYFRIYFRARCVRLQTQLLLCQILSFTKRSCTTKRSRDTCFAALRGFSWKINIFRCLFHKTTSNTLQGLKRAGLQELCLLASYFSTSTSFYSWTPLIKHKLVR